MDSERWNPLNRRDLPPGRRDLFHVRISKPGPRGGVRPPLWEGFVYAEIGAYSAAVADAENAFLATTKTEVIAGG